MISRLKKDIFIVIELVNPENVSFLYNKGREQNDEYKFINSGMDIDGTGSFAAGEVYFSNIMDNLITQAYYNESLLAVLKKLIVGGDQSIHRKNPLKKYRDIISSNLYSIDFPASIRNNQTSLIDADSLIKEKPAKFLFKDIFLKLIKQKTILIGIYRAVDLSSNFIPGRTNLDKTSLNSNFYYVVTSPGPDTEINPKDKLFVLSQNFPIDENLYLKENENSEVKKIDFTNEKNYDMYNFEVSKLNKKNEENKENHKIPDHIGEKKIQELNISLNHMTDNLKDLNGSISKIGFNLEKNLSEGVRNKFKNITSKNNSNSNSKNNNDNDNSGSIKNNEITKFDSDEFLKKISKENNNNELNDNIIKDNYPKSQFNSKNIAINNLKDIEIDDINNNLNDKKNNSDSSLDIIKNSLDGEI
jgi:hypothetical protein